jgi:hypothetical protein
MNQAFQSAHTFSHNEAPHVVSMARTDTLLATSQSAQSWYSMQAAVVKVQWRTGMDTEILFGLADGSLQIGRVAQNKSLELYKHKQGAAVVSMCCIPPSNGSSASPGVVVGHVDGSISRFILDASTDVPAGVSTICRHSCPPYALACNRDALLAGGTDLKVTSYTIQGRVTKSIDLAASKPELQDLTCAAVPSAGDSAVVGAFNAFLLFDFNARELVRSASEISCATCCEFANRKLLHI